MSDHPDARSFRLDLNSLHEPREPMVTVPTSLLARALHALDDVGFANVPGERLAFAERVRGEIRTAIGGEAGAP